MNGAIVEQRQIVTMHNLATLFDSLQLRLDLDRLASACLAWVMRNLPKPDDLRRLRKLKNCAYAWRQMVFYLSVAPSSVVERFFREHDTPQLADLQRSWRGDRNVTPFLGWVVPPGNAAR